MLTLDLTPFLFQVVKGWIWEFTALSTKTRPKNWLVLLYFLLQVHDYLFPCWWSGNSLILTSSPSGPTPCQRESKDLQFQTETYGKTEVNKWKSFYLEKIFVERASIKKYTVVFIMDNYNGLFSLFIDINNLHTLHTHDASVAIWLCRFEFELNSFDKQWLHKIICSTTTLIQPNSFFYLDLKMVW